MNMMHPEERTHFKVLFIIFISLWAAFTIVSITTAKDSYTLYDLWRWFFNPIIAPLTASIAAMLIGQMFHRLTGDVGWILYKSFWSKQIFILIPIGFWTIYMGLFA